MKPWTDLGRRLPLELVHPSERPQEDSSHVDKKLWHYTQWKHWIADVLQPSVIVEIGVRAGYSALSFLNACPSASYRGFDLDAGTDGGQVGFTQWANLKFAELGYDAHATFPFDSQAQPIKIVGADLYHIDGDHSYRGALHDLEMCWGLMGDDSFLVVDDYSYIAPVTSAVDQFLKLHPNLRFIKLPSSRGDVIIYSAGSKKAAELVKGFKDGM